MSTKGNDSWVLVGKDGRTHDLSHGMIFIGREECDIVLQAASADKRHAVLCYNNGEQKFHIKDLNSLTGTYVNGIRIPEQTYMKLKRLDCIRFGYGPDVFYLEKSSSATSPSNEEKSISPKNDIEKKTLEEELKAKKSNLKFEEASNKNNKNIHGCELPALTREDNPPDTLSLNLSNIRQQDKEWDWIGQDGALSDSPDYSQRSETSSCSAPPNYGTTTGEDRDTGSAHSSPAATAFTIAFETEASTPRKKLGIRDSISKFAPNKIDSESRVSFQKSNKTEASPAPFQKSNKADTGPVSYQKSSKTDPSAAPYQKSSKTEPSPKKLPLPDKGKTKSKPEFGCGDIKDINQEIGKITDSTSFLIKKMLNGEISPSDIPEEMPSKEKLPQNLQNDVNDDRSEAGTYTVETEQADCDVEEARKKIDEVFGVIQLSNSVLSSSYSSSTTSSSNKQIPRLNGRLKPNILKSSITPKQREPNIQWNSGTKTYGRNRGQGPTPAASTESLNHSDTLPRSLQRTRKMSDPPPTPDRTRRAKLATSPKSPGKTKTPSTLKSPGSLSNNLSAAPSSRESSSKAEDVTRRRSTDTRSEGSKSPHASAQWQKVPWNLSGSDLDLDRSKSENNSILSDTSTEPSSHSSHSGQSRPDQAPQMRLNRAFALRRARLEAESGKRGKENRASTGSSQKPIKKSAKLSSSTSTLRDESSSGGSSKMNFRLAPTVSKPFTGRQMVQCSDPLKRKIVSSHNMDEYQCRSSNKEITALDSLVISAIHQLASKLWANSKELLERERKKCPKGSDTWLMIDEVLPQGPVTGTPEDGDFTKDLSSILKNLKRVEQGLDVLSSILENGRDPEPGVEEKTPLPQNFFVVNM